MKLRAVTRKPPAAFDARPDWAHPNNLAHQDSYARAVAWLRRGKSSIWIMDRESLTPSWRAIPQEEQTA